MKESDFSRKHLPKWERLEEVLQEKSKEADELTELFVEVTEDLSYARTFYPKRRVRHYLNTLSLRIFKIIYNESRQKGGQFLDFWRYEIPAEVWRARKDMLTALVCFLLAVGIGVLSTVADADFPEIILGASYVEMTKDNIAQGDPMAVYKKAHEVDMFLGITINNVRVALLAFVSGALYAVGTVFIILYNGVMLGSFQTFFFNEGLLYESFLTIWIHGTIEISVIVVAAGAGLTMGRGLVLPGSYSRARAFRRGAQRGAKIFLSTVPFFVLAGFLEGFITRLTEQPEALRLLIIFLSLALILFYYVIWPWRIRRTRPLPPEPDEVPEALPEWTLRGFHSLNEVFVRGLFLFRYNFKVWMRYALPIFFLLSLPEALWRFPEEPALGLRSPIFLQGFGAQGENFPSYLFAGYPEDLVGSLLSVLPFAGILALSLSLFLLILQGNNFQALQDKRTLGRLLLRSFPVSVLFLGAARLAGFYVQEANVLIVSVLCYFVLAFLCYFVLPKEKGRSFKQSIPSFASYLLWAVAATALFSLLFLLVNTPVASLYEDILRMNLMEATDERYILAFDVLYVLLIKFVLSLVVPYFTFVFFLFVLHAQERKSGAAYSASLEELFPKA